MTAVAYISDVGVIVKASWSLFQHHGAAAFKLSERSPVPPALSTKELLGGRTQIWNVCKIRSINHDPVESDEDWAPERIPDTEIWLNWNGDLDNPNDSKYECMGDDESDIEQHHGIEDPECPEQQDVSATPNVAGYIWPTLKSKRQPEQMLLTVNAIKIMRNWGVKRILNRMR